MSRRRLLLISPPVTHAERWWANRIANKPHLASLAGVVRDVADVQVLELDITTDEQLDDLLHRVDEHLRQPVALVGISCWTSLHYLGTLAVAERVRSLAPDVPIVVGGHHATAMPRDFDRDVCDWVVCGDGEEPLRKLCSEWPKRPDRMEILFGAPFDQSDPSHIDWKHYARPGIAERAIWVGLTRGCAFKCRFCVEPQRGPTYSGYSVADALDIIEGLVETHGPRVIAFSDPLFGVNRRWTEAFLEGIENRRLPLMFWAQTRADFMTPQLLERFKRCGFMLDFGLDAASETMVERMEKAANPRRYLARAREVLGQANTIGLHHGVYIVFNFPGETPQTVRETQRFVESLGAGDGPMSCWLSSQTFFILPGTHAYLKMRENAQTYGTDIRHPVWWKEHGDHYALATDVLPSREWAGNEHHLGAFTRWNQRMNAAWGARYPEDVRAFRYTFYVG